MARYWGMVARLAWRDTLELLGWGDWRKILVRGGSSIVVIAIAVALFGWEERTQTRMTFLVLTVAASLGAFALLCAAHFLVIPPRLRRQDEVRIKSLEKQKNDAEAARAAGRALQPLFDAGTALLASGRGGDAYSSPYWDIKVVEWFAGLDEAADRHLTEAAAFMVKTIVPRPDPGYGPQEHLASLGGQLNKLRFVIGRLLSGEEPVRAGDEQGDTP